MAADWTSLHNQLLSKLSHPAAKSYGCKFHKLTMCCVMTLFPLACPVMYYQSISLDKLSLLISILSQPSKNIPQYAKDTDTLNKFKHHQHDERSRLIRRQATISTKPQLLAVKTNCHGLILKCKTPSNFGNKQEEEKVCVGGGLVPLDKEEAASLSL